MLGVRVARARTADQFEGKTALVIVIAIVIVIVVAIAVVVIAVVVVVVVAVLFLRWVEAIRIRREVIFLKR